MPTAGDDDTLREGLAAGREDAFVAVYDRFASRLLATAWGMLGSRADAEDAVQDVFLSLVRSRSSLGRVEDLRAYLFASLRHAAIRRRRRRDDPPPAREAVEASSPGSPIAAERAARLERALASLPPEQREVVALKVDGGLTFAEIAAVLRTSPNTVAGRYRYAMEKMRARLED